MLSLTVCAAGQVSFMFGKQRAQRVYVATASGGRWLAVLLTLPNVGVVGVWAFTAVNEWFLYTRESVPVYSLTMCGGGPVSLIGLAAGLAGLVTGRSADRGWWWACVTANGVGLFANCAGFIGYMAPGC